MNAEQQTSASSAELNRVLNALAELLAPRICQVVEERLANEVPRAAGLLAQQLAREVIGKVKPLNPLATLSKAEVAAILHVSEDTLERLAARGVLCPIPRLGVVRYSVREVARFVNAEPADGYRDPLPDWAVNRAKRR